MFISVFDLYKIGIGPSSSHTVGPMVAANKFLEELKHWSKAPITHLKVYLHGSLAFTGVGHATDRAVILGLCGQQPDKVTSNVASALLQHVHSAHIVTPPGQGPYRFDPEKDLIFDYEHILPGHTNGLAFEGYDDAGQRLLRSIYYSIGGGFVVTEQELTTLSQAQAQPSIASVPFPFQTAKQMLAMAKESQLSIANMMRKNEEAQRTGADVEQYLDNVWQTMQDSMDRGFCQSGNLPGSLKIKRRAKDLYDQLSQISSENTPVHATEWLCAYALAVNEENAAGGRVVTAPTNGAAGVIPAVLKYFLTFYGGNQEAIHDFLLTAGAIGGLIKANASISGAEVGCQGEIGAASSMAAAGLAAVLGGSPEQIENAAEIALEHHLGMTCDPVAGLVQVPCIERNAFGAVKAVTAATLSLRGTGEHFVSLDVCIETMRQTGHDMSSRYKETSQAGLAVNIVEC